MRMDSERKVTAAGEPLIEFRGVDKFFDKPEEGRYQVVGDLNIKVRENEFLVLFGPGQCGKSTILNLIAGFEMPSSGHVLCMGKDITGPGPDRGMVFQNTALFPWLTVMGNVEYGPKVRGIKKEERRQRAQHYIDLVGLQGFENSFPVKLSGGMQQRVGIARAYCNEPLVMLLDEPFGHLDAQTRYLMQDELTRIWQAEKRTVIFVTNNIEEAVYLADRILVLRNCPTGVKAEYEINLPRPRNYTDPEFLRLRREIDSVVDHTLERRCRTMANKEPKVKVQNLTKRFGDLLVLDNLNFEVEEGEFLCIVGPTGCGKTTFLNSLTRLYEPTAGDILVNGIPVNPKKQNISYIFQEYSSFPWLTVEQNIRFGLEIKKTPKAEADANVEEMLDIVGLTKFRNYYPSQLSISMLQRVAIARAFATKPELLLMDEPYGQLDIDLRFKLEDELIKLWKKTGTTVLFITHNIEEAVYLSQKIMVLTNKPTSVKTVLDNPLPLPRDVVSPEFVELRNKVTDLIKWW